MAYEEGRFSVVVPSVYMEDVRISPQPLPGSYGMCMVVREVGPKGERSGLCEGDVIEQVNGRAVNDATLPNEGQLTLAVRRSKYNDERTFTLDSDEGTLEKLEGKALDSSEPKYEEIAVTSSGTPQYRAVKSEAARKRRGGDRGLDMSNLKVSMVEEVVSASPLKTMPSMAPTPVIPMSKIKPEVHFGVRVYRVQMRSWDLRHDQPLYSLAYHIHNDESVDKHIQIDIIGDDIVISSAEDVHVDTHENTHTVRRVLPGSWSGLLFTILPPEGGTRPATYRSKMFVQKKASPQQSSEELKGVILKKMVTHALSAMTVEFNIRNTNAFPIQAHIGISGGDFDGSHFTPELFVGSQSEMSMGRISTSNKIKVRWSWKEDRVVRSKTAEYELKGVILARTLTPSTNSTPGTAILKVTNTHSFPVVVDVHILHGSKDDKVSGVAPPHAERVELGEPVAVRGKVTVKWKWSQQS